jgi:8-hydroxy-5-deazaflavin:NADPH oxidoreductase
MASRPTPVPAWIGILGSGLMGGKLGTLFARAGHEVVFSYSRRRQKLDELGRDAGGKARAGTPLAYRFERFGT